MAGQFGVSMTDPPIHHSLPQRQPDVDRGSISQDAAPHPMAVLSPILPNLRTAANVLFREIRLRIGDRGE